MAENELITELSLKDSASEKLRAAGEKFRQFSEKFGEIRVRIGERIGESIARVGESMLVVGDGLTHLKEGFVELSEVASKAWEVIAGEAIGGALAIHEAMKEQTARVGLKASIQLSGQGASMAGWDNVVKQLRQTTTMGTAQIETSLSQLAQMGYSAHAASKLSQLAVGIVGATGGTVNAQTALNSLVAAQQGHVQSAMRELPQLRGLMPMAMQAQKNPAELQYLMDRIVAVAQRGFAVGEKLRNGTLSGQLQVLRNDADDLAASFGSMLLPQLQKLTGYLDNVVRALKHMSPALKQQIVGWAETGAAIAGTLMVLPRVIGVIAGGTRILYNFAAGMTQIALGAVGVAASIGGLVVSAVAGLAKAAWTGAMAIARLGEKMAFAGLSAAMTLGRALMSVTVSAIKATIEVTAHLAKKLMDFGIDVAVDVAHKVKDLADGIWDLGKKMLSVAMDAAADLGKSLLNLAADGFNVAMDAAAALADMIMEVVATAGLALVPIAAIGATLATLGYILFQTSGGFAWLGSMMSSVFSGVIDLVKDIGDSIRTVAKVIWDSLKGAFSSVWNFAAAGATSFFSFLLSKIEFVGIKIEVFLKRAFENAFASIAQKVDAIKMSLAATKPGKWTSPQDRITWDAKSGAMDGIASMFSGFHGSTGNASREAANNAAIQNLVDKMILSRSGIDTYVRGLHINIREVNPKVAAMAKRFGVNPYASFKMPAWTSPALGVEKLKKALADLGKEGSASVSKLAAELTNPKTAEKIGKSMGAIIAGIKTNMPAGENYAAKVFEGMLHMSSADAHKLAAKFGNAILHPEGALKAFGKSPITVQRPLMPMQSMGIGAAFQKQAMAFAIAGMGVEMEKHKALKENTKAVNHVASIFKGLTVAQGVQIVGGAFR